MIKIILHLFVFLFARLLTLYTTNILDFLLKTSNHDYLQAQSTEVSHSEEKNRFQQRTSDTTWSVVEEHRFLSAADEHSARILSCSVLRGPDQEEDTDAATDGAAIKPDFLNSLWKQKAEREPALISCQKNNTISKTAALPLQEADSSHTQLQVRIQPGN